MDQTASSAFDLLDERIQRWIWEAGWSDLKDAQERAIASILKPAAEHDVIIAAATASGKTEAAFFPVLTHMLGSHEDCCVVYVSPLKALINDQWSRLERLCDTLEIPVTPWHGDIGDTKKKRFLKRPHGCLLITPESLEGLLIRQGNSLGGLLGGLQFIVIDELHAFIDSPRGTQLQSQMHRIEVALKRRVRRVGLSATLGEMRLAAEFLRPKASGSVDIIDSKGGGQELKVLVKGYYDLPPRLSEKEVEAREAAGEEIQKEDIIPEAWVAIGQQLFESLRGSNNLVFPNSRAKVELFADLLRRACEQAGVPNEFWPHHGSLAKEIREETEAALKQGERPATAVATTTLELGIDIGAVKSVAQIGPAPSVASLRQRLGRSGRRKGEPAILRAYCVEPPLDLSAPLSDRLREGLLQTVAQVNLLTRGWFEPPRMGGLDASTFVQQLLSLVAQYGGVTAAQAWQLLVAGGVFENVSKDDYLELLRELGRKEILQQDSQGSLLPSPKGERIINHYSFLAAFASEEEFRILANGRPLGSLPISRPLDEGSYVIFAGRRWLVVACSQEDKVIEVMPAKGGKVPAFDGMGGKVHDVVRGEMRALLESQAVPPFLDPVGQALLSEARSIYQAAGLDKESVQQYGKAVQIFTWRGDWANDSLALMLVHRGLRAQNEGLTIAIDGAAAERVFDALYDIANEPAPDPLELVARVQNKWRRKWDWALPERLLALSYALDELDVPNAVGAARDVIARAEKTRIP
jgi:ATP-dependent Lhr-like helicase